MRPRAALLLIVLVLLCTTVSLFFDWTNVREGAGHVMQLLSRHHFSLPYLPPPAKEQWQTMRPEERLADVRSRLLPELHDQLAANRFLLGQPAFIRIFKESRELELWIQNKDGTWALFRNYPIACYSGSLGPKTREGDMQAPEGFYLVTQKQLNPASSYHLSFNIGYPNDYDLALQRTGSLIMIHGDECSIGCFAMTDPLIEEIYLIVEAALQHTASVPVHIFPFRMSDERLQSEKDSPHHDFWQDLHTFHELFVQTLRVPQVIVKDGRYQAR